MEYIYYKAKQGNFGDDLNAWLWPKFFGENNPAGDYFIGIGSILFSEHKLLKTLTSKKKIVFGSGAKPGNKPLLIDDTWDVRFVRGPLSVAALGNKHKYISDGAYAVRLIEEFKQLSTVAKKYKVSVMPYFHSTDYFDWKNICRQLGYHYISPLAEDGIEHTLQEIAASEFIISEAMHGAIIADALRIPWSRFVLTTPYTEGHIISEFKWMDWLYSIELIIDKPVLIKFYRNSDVNAWIKNLTRNRIDVKFLPKRKVKQDIIEQLSSVKNYYLSEDTVIKNADAKMHEEISIIRKMYNIK